MRLKLHFTQPTTEQEKILPGISSVAEGSLWAFPGDGAFTATDLQTLIDAFDPLKGVIWDAFGVPLISLRNRARDQGKPFARQPMLSRNLITQTTTEYLMIPGKTYSGVAWIATETLTEITELLSRTRGLDFALAFLSQKAGTVEDWANIASGLYWLWQCQNRIATEPIPIFNTDAVLLNHIGLTIKIGGAAGLVIESLDAIEGDPKKALVLYAPSALLAKVVAQIGTKATILSEADFARWLRRGARFNSSP